MPNHCHVEVIGHLTRTPEIRQAGSTTVCEVGIAYNDYKKNANFFDCVAFGKTADLIAGHFEKGDAVMFIGELRQDRWEDKKTGQKRSKVQIIVNRVVFLGGGKPSESRGEGQTEYATSLPDDGDEPAF